MAAVLSITEQELLDALAESVVGNAPADAMTAKEMAALAGVSHDKVTLVLKQFQAEGRLAVHTVERRDIIGRLQKVPAFTILPAKKKK